NLVEEMCDQILLIHQGKQMIYGSLEEVKLAHANTKCMIYGKNNQEIWDKIQGIENIEHDGNRTILYIQRGISITEWIRSLPEHLHIIEMNVERISLHEIFVAIANETYEEQESVFYA